MSVAPVAARPCHITLTTIDRSPMSPAPPHADTSDMLLLLLARSPQLSRCSCSRPRLLPNDYQAANGDTDRKRMVEMRRLELLTPSVQRRCSSN